MAKCCENDNLIKKEVTVPCEHEQNNKNICLAIWLNNNTGKNVLCIEWDEEKGWTIYYK